MPSGRRQTTRMPCGPQLARELAGQSLDGGAGDPETAGDPGRHERAERGEREDHAGALLDHVPRRCRGRQEVRDSVGRDRQGVVGEGHLGQWHGLDQRLAEVAHARLGTAVSSMPPMMRAERTRTGADPPRAGVLGTRVTSPQQAQTGGLVRGRSAGTSPRASGR
jgi:hypothetical protein